MQNLSKTKILLFRSMYLKKTITLTKLHNSCRTLHSVIYIVFKKNSNTLSLTHVIIWPGGAEKRQIITKYLPVMWTRFWTRIGSVSATSWIWIRIRNTDPGPEA